MHPNARLIETLYSSLSSGDPYAAATCYTSDASFEDIAFRLEGRSDIRNMWRMACHAGVTVSDPHAEFADDESGRGRWVADYMFDKTETSPGRPIVNKIASEFVFRDGAILRHYDRCDPVAWAKQAYSSRMKSFLVGRIPLLRRKGARSKLRKFLREHPDITEDFG